MKYLFGTFYYEQWGNPITRKWIIFLRNRPHPLLFFKRFAIIVKINNIIFSKLYLHLYSLLKLILFFQFSFFSDKSHNTKLLLPLLLLLLLLLQRETMSTCEVKWRATPLRTKWETRMSRISFSRSHHYKRRFRRSRIFKRCPSPLRSPFATTPPVTQGYVFWPGNTGKGSVGWWMSTHVYWRSKKVETELLYF